jgi:HEAT repeat protein
VHRVAILLVFVLLQGLFAQQRVHLRNGRYIDVESAVQQGGSFILKVGFGTLRLKVEEVLRIEKIRASSPRDLAGKIDEINLKNGGLIEGKIVAQDASKIILATRNGIVEIGRDQIVVKKERVEPQPIRPPPPESTPERIEAVQTPEEVSALDKEIDSILEEMRGADPDKRYEIAVKLAGLGEEALPGLIDRLQKVEDDLVSWIGTGISQIKSKKAVQALIKGLKSQRPLVRKTIISTLASSGDRGAIGAIRGMLTDEVPEVRGKAIDALAYLNDVESLSDIAAMIKDRALSVRRRVVYAVLKLAKGAQSKGEVSEILIDTLDWVDEPCKVQIAELLGRLGAQGAVPGLIGLIDSELKDVRAKAIMALGVLRAKDALGPLVERLGYEEDRWVKIQITGALQKIGDEGAVPVLIDLLLDEDPDIRSASSRALAEITNQYHLGMSYDKWVRWWEARRPK